MLENNTFRRRLSKLVAIPSVSCTSTQYDMSNLTIVEELATWLDELGFSTRIVALEGFPGKYNLLATLGRGEGGLLLAGHTDTVPYNAQKWQQDPFTLTEREGRFYGLGATDMKGFFPVVLAAIERVITASTRLKRPLTILATADEESSMSGARSLSQEELGGASYAVIGEPTGLQPVYMHKGIMMEEIQIEGRSGHSSDPTLGASALEAMNAAINALLRFRSVMQEQQHNPGFAVAHPTLNLGCIHGGDNPNRICAACHLQYDLRLLPGQNINKLRQDIDAILQPIGEQFGVRVSTQPLFPGIPAFEQDKNSTLVNIAQELTGHEAVSVAFATEAPYLHGMGAQTIVMGPGSIEVAHQPNEYIEAKQILPAIDIIEKLIYKICA